MAKQKLSLNKHARQVRRRYLNTRAKARWVGFFYLIATLALAGLAIMYPTVFPAVNGEMASLGVVGKFWTGLSGLKDFAFTRAMAFPLLFSVMALVLVINVFRALGQLGGLYTKKINKIELDTLNTNVGAMEALGKIFSSTFFTILMFSFGLALLNADASMKELFAGNSDLQLLGNNGVYNAYIIFGVGVFFHLVLGAFGSNVSLHNVFTDEELGISYLEEYKREVGVFASFFRNLLQLVAVGAIMFYFLKYNNLVAFTGILLDGSTFNVEGFMAHIQAEGQLMSNLVVPALEILVSLCLIPMAKHATALTEYNAEGAKGPGMKTFRIFDFFVLILTAAYFYLVFELDFEAAGAMDVIYVAAIALVMFIIEIMLRRYPCTAAEKAERKAEKANKKAAKKAKKAEKAEAQKVYATDEEGNILYDEDGNPIEVVEEAKVKEIDPNIVDINYFFTEDFTY